MGTDPRKRQKKLERRNAKRKDKKHQLIRQQNVGLGERLTAAARYPILDCLISDSVDEQGLGWVVLSREMPNGSVAVANFLVDRYCLGVKNIHAEILGRSSYDERYARRMRTEMPSHKVSPAEARKFLEAAVAYAHEIGFHPHPDYRKALPLFGSVDSAESTATFEFGKDGKPFFVSGPNDTPERCRQVLAILENTCGPGGYDYLIMVGGPEFDGAPPGLDEFDDEDLDEPEDSHEVRK